MKLYNSMVSGNCYKVRWMLALLGKSYETIELEVRDAVPGMQCTCCSNRRCAPARARPYRLL